MGGGGTSPESFNFYYYRYSTEAGIIPACISFIILDFAEASEDKQ